jgi:DNA-binding Lrp family transcriptional regulator
MTLTAIDQRVLAFFRQSDYRLSARNIAARLNLKLEVARATAQRLVKAGLVTSEVVREFDQYWKMSRFSSNGGACVRRRAYYSAIYPAPSSRKRS